MMVSPQNTMPSGMVTKINNEEALRGSGCCEVSARCSLAGCEVARRLRDLTKKVEAVEAFQHTGWYHASHLPVCVNVAGCTLRLKWITRPSHVVHAPEAEEHAHWSEHPEGTCPQEPDGKSPFA